MSCTMRAPVHIDRTNVFKKHQASKFVRQVPVTDDIPSGGYYRKHFAVRGNRQYNPKDLIDHAHTMYGFTDKKGISHRFIIK
jgi:hypothetical protein